MWRLKRPSSKVHTMQGISICGSVASPHGANCGRACVRRNSTKLPYEINVVSHGAYSCYWRMSKLHIKTSGRRMNATIRTNARWLFGGEGRSSDARLERSESANEDILIFYFQMDLQTRIQVSSSLLACTSESIVNRSYSSSCYYLSYVYYFIYCLMHNQFTEK